MTRRARKSKDLDEHASGDHTKDVAEEIAAHILTYFNACSYFGWEEPAQHLRSAYDEILKIGATR